MQYVDTYKHSITNLIAEYGDHSLVPKDRLVYHGEVLRAHYILTLHPEAAPSTVLRQHGVMEAVIKELVGAEVETVTRKVKRSEKYQSIVDYCHAHALEQVSAEQVAAVGEVSYQTALKFINDRVDLFRKVKRGVYEIRDVKAERAAV